MNKTHLIVTIHGIRDFGHWQDRLAERIRQTNPNIEVLNYRYGFVWLLTFLLPFARWILVGRFRNWLHGNILEHRQGVERVDFVAHSLGTYIVGKYLASLVGQGGPHRPGTVIFAGSVLPEEFNVAELLERRVVARVVNECGVRDVPLICSQLFGLGTGMAGRVGFLYCGTGACLQNRFFDFGHGGWFYNEDGRQGEERMGNLWLPLLVGPLDQPIPVCSLGRGLSWWERVILVVLRNARPVKVAMYTLILGGLVFGPLTYFLFQAQQIRHEREMKELATKVIRYSHFVEAAKLSDRDPRYVGQTLYGDLARETRSSGQLDGLADLWGSLRFLDPESQTPKSAAPVVMEIARRLDAKADPTPADLHLNALAKTWLLANEADVPSVAGEPLPTPGEVKDAFEKALARYEEDGGQKKLLTLCRFDYGQSMIRIREQQEGFDLLSEVVRDGENYPWLRVEGYLARAQAKRYNDPEVATRQLDGARAVAEASALDQEYLLGKIHLQKGWHHLDPGNAEDAGRAFQESVRYFSINREGDLRARVGWYHARHGQAMVLRYNADPRAAEEFKKLIEKIDGDLRPYSFSLRQRKDLVDRIINSTERLGDSHLFGWSCQACRDGAARGAEAYRELLAEYPEKYNFDPASEPPTFTRVRCKLAVAYALSGQTTLARETLAAIKETDKDDEQTKRYVKLTRACTDLLLAPLQEKPARLAALAKVTIEMASQGVNLRRDQAEFVVLARYLYQDESQPNDSNRKVQKAVTDLLHERQGQNKAPALFNKAL